MTRTLTAANVVVTLTQKDLFPVAYQFSGYSADKVWSNAAVKMAEHLMGVDGHLSRGYTPNPVPFTISLQADSPGVDIMDAIIAATIAARTAYPFNVVITVPATGKSYIGTNGGIDEVKIIPDASKILQPQEYTWIFETLLPTLL